MTKRNTRLRVWVEGQRLRWYSVEGSRQSTPIPNFESLDKRQLENLRLTWELTLNNGRVNPLTGTVVTATMTVSQLWWHYLHNQGPNLRDGGYAYKSAWRHYIDPRWGQTLIADVRTLAVEQWLRDLRNLDGELMSKEYVQKIRTTMSAMFTHAMRAELSSTNPISCGGSDIGKGGSRGSGAGARILGEHTPKRPTLRFGAEQIVPILEELDTRDRALVLLDSVLGLRRGELALRWEDCDFEASVFHIRRSFNWRLGTEGGTKTEASSKQLPMHPVLREALLEWQEQTPFLRPEDYVFPSVRLKGRKPLSMMEVFKRKIRPVIEKLGFAKPDDTYGWHAFRHGVGTTLWDLTRDKLTVRDLLRHGKTGNITELYMHGIDRRLVDAQDKLVGAIFTPQVNPGPKPQGAELLKMRQRRAVS